mgnify:CR=1 FL=1
MSSYFFESSGSFSVGGCSLFSSYAYYWCKYSIGSIVYLRSKALKGKFEKIVIKSIIIPKFYDPAKIILRKNIYARTVYVDSMNALFLENELINYDDAVYYANNYENASRIKAEKYALNCK